MPTSRMLVQQYVEQTAVVEVEAESEEAAEAMIGATERGIECGDMAPAWEEGEDVIDVAVYAIQTADGEEFWTR